MIASGCCVYNVASIRDDACHSLVCRQLDDQSRPGVLRVSDLREAVTWKRCNNYGRPKDRDRAYAMCRPRRCAALRRQIALTAFVIVHTALSAADSRH